ncbi:MAG: hypothetical protein ABIH39_06940 [Candidatus Margulisiibacteriota bacterium]
MGSTFTAIADDATAVFYNPGGIQALGFQYYIENSDYKNYTLDRADNYILQWKNLLVADWHNRDKQGREIDVFAYSLGQGGNTGWGFTYKRVVSNYGTDGYTVDFGMLMNIAETTKIGFVAQDLFKENVDVRTTLRGGLSTRMMGNKMLLAVDEEFYRSPQPIFIMHYGIEYEFSTEMDVRAGWNDGNFTGGISLLFDFGTLEYAVATSADLNQESVHSIAINIGRKRNVPEAAVRNDRSYKPREAEIRRLQRGYQRSY